MLRRLFPIAFLAIASLLTQARGGTIQDPLPAINSAINPHDVIQFNGGADYIPHIVQVGTIPVTRQASNTTAPEPGTLLLSGAAITALVLFGRRRCA